MLPVPGLLPTLTLHNQLKFADLTDEGDITVLALLCEASVTELFPVFHGVQVSPHGLLGILRKDQNLCPARAWVHSLAQAVGNSQGLDSKGV